MMDKDWGAFEDMVESVDDKIENTIIWFPKPLPLKDMKDPRFLFFILIKLHDMGVMYPPPSGPHFWSSGYTPPISSEKPRKILKKKLQIKFGKPVRVPQLYRHKDFSEEQLYCIRIDENKHLYYGTEKPPLNYRFEDKKKDGYKVVDVFDLF
jgi:hypothetical protein